MRYTKIARITTKYAGFKLADDGTQPRPKVATPSVIRAELVALAYEWFDAGWMENPEQFASDLRVERNANDPNRVDAIVSPDVINAFLVFAGQIAFIR
jgi:phage tail sheath gpL-like